MAVFRIDKTKNYTVMANYHLRDTTLSLKAKGLLSLMLSLPEGWDYTTKGLACICKDGVDSICSTVKELENAGYVQRRRLRNELGHLTEVEYTILEKPVRPDSTGNPPKAGKAPKRENPVLEKPVLGSPVLDIALMLQFFLFGLCITLFPYVRGYIVDRAIEDDASSFLVQMEETETPEVTDGIASTMEAQVQETFRDYERLWADMTAYNERIYAQHQSGLSCEYDYQQPSFVLKNYGLTSEIFGVISIPAMELEMPIYLGATGQHMADGAAHMTQTSLPIGGQNTNAVIAGHRGYNGASYFRYIDKLQPGDLVMVRNLWDTLNYRVSGIKIIDPHDVEEILIQDGRELLTLITCHPYASGGKQRYVVYCERVSDAL